MARSAPGLHRQSGAPGEARQFAALTRPGAPPSSQCRRQLYERAADTSRCHRRRAERGVQVLPRFAGKGGRTRETCIRDVARLPRPARWRRADGEMEVAGTADPEFCFRIGAGLCHSHRPGRFARRSSGRFAGNVRQCSASRSRARVRSEAQLWPVSRRRRKPPALRICSNHPGLRGDGCSSNTGWGSRRGQETRPGGYVARAAHAPPETLPRHLCACCVSSVRAHASRGVRLCGMAASSVGELAAPSPRGA
jgi:hypothetical protein